MANRGLDDISRFESKVQFALMAVPIPEVVRTVRMKLGGNLTSVTLESWKAGRNRPSRSKLELFSRALGIRMEDFYEDFYGFVDVLSTVRGLAERDREIFLKRIEERQSGSVKLDVFGRTDTDYTQRLFHKIGGHYILYNYSMNNVPEINQTLVSVECTCHPFIRVSAHSVRDKDHVTSYQGRLFPVRSNLHFVMETGSTHHEEVVMIVTNNPVHQGGRLRFLYGVILSGSEDFVSHPSAARVFMEKMPEGMTAEQVLEKIGGTTQENIPSYCRKLVRNDISQADGDYVLRAEQLNMSYVLGLMNEENGDG
ncbi:hypothetical protein [Salidesulfovibrio onnuriiensis]|uniref:hypothetical protein n=1 Tax=Salidesulfovibrio onnuriiensis TaxID=2583823 RepID=UPI0011CBDD98|nr:hypothetical protein [Salidesulfovibrio onnuriiensis]